MVSWSWLGPDWMAPGEPNGGLTPRLDNHPRAGWPSRPAGPRRFSRPSSPSLSPVPPPPADFGNAGELRTISRNVRNFVVEDAPVSGGLSVSLNPAPIGSSNNGFFTGSAGYAYRGVTVRDGGKWGGRFFGNGEADGKSGSFAGTSPTRQARVFWACLPPKSSRSHGIRGPLAKVFRWASDGRIGMYGR